MAFVWIVDPIVLTLEVLSKAGEVYTIHQVFTHEDRARAEPFDAIELALSDLWARWAPRLPDQSVHMFRRGEG